MGSRSVLTMGGGPKTLIIRTTALLAPAATYASPLIDVTGFRRVTGESLAAAGQDGTIILVLSEGTALLGNTQSIPTITDPVTGLEVADFTQLTRSRFIGFTYLNGAAPQTAFEFAVWGEPN
jgi:hypothetical protein